MASAQLKVLTPKALSTKIQTSLGTNHTAIPGATSTFGAPFYGEIVLGQLFFVDSPSNYCTADLTFYNISNPQKSNSTTTTTTSTQSVSSTTSSSSTSTSTPRGSTNSTGSTTLTATTTHTTVTTTLNIPSVIKSDKRNLSVMTYPPPPFDQPSLSHDPQSASMQSTRDGQSRGILTDSDPHAMQSLHKPTIIHHHLSSPDMPPLPVLSLPHRFLSSADSGQGLLSHGSLSRVIKNVCLIRRGGCAFSVKVRNAQANECDAVVMVDSPESKWTRLHIRHVIMADSGKGSDITIPSLLICNQDGEQLISAMNRQEVDGAVFVELEWSLPRKGVVDVDFWSDSGREETERAASSGSWGGRRFLEEFVEAAETLGGHLRFKIHFFIFSMPPNIADDMCWDGEGKFCAETPAQLVAPVAQVASEDTLKPITGRDVVEEDLRQLCLFKTTARPVEGISESSYSREFWEYIKKWLNGCSLRGLTRETRFGVRCSDRIMQEIVEAGGAIDIGKVRDCMKGEDGRKMLEEEKALKPWGVLALRINDIRLSGSLNSETVVKAVCAAFETPPEACTTLLKKIDENRLNALAQKLLHSDAFSSLHASSSNSSNTKTNDELTVPKETTVSRSSSSSSVWTLAFFVLVIISLCLFLYQRFIKSSVRHVLREEVMNEVKMQMQDYQQLSGDNGERQAVHDGHHISRHNNAAPRMY
eukprot:GHVQ01009956.1.p1 GENE.GHVQ01009956.1~~GHVQ01009956.1.p1  ORF type:complete len:763 (-),score=166.93 GHVQ01009956.1:501-2603(-)